MFNSLDTFDFQAAAAALLSWLGFAVLWGSVLAVATWFVAQTLLRRARPAIHAAVWLVVLLKFIVPAGPGWSYSLSSLVSGATGWFDAPPIAASNTAVVLSDADAYLLVLGSEADSATVAASGSLAASGPVISAAMLAAIAYLLGLCTLATVRLWSYRRYLAACRRLPPADEPTRELVHRNCRRNGLRRLPSVRISRDAPAPFVIGFPRPMLVLSTRQLADTDELEAVVLHEIAHLRRGDMLVRYLQWLVGMLLFFWPVVAWVNRRIDLAREHACDEWALRRARLSAGQYARCLLRAVRPAKSRWAAYSPAAMASSKKHVERRIDMIMSLRMRKSAPWIGLPGVLVVSVWSAFALTGSGVAQDQQAEPAEPTPHRVMVIQSADGEMQVQVQTDDGAMEGHPALGQFIFQSDDGEAGPQMLMLHALGGLGGQDLVEFGADYPAADVNSDGKISNTEYSAYLVALAMADPDAVVGKFSKADADKNGELTDLEAARLVTGNSSGQLHQIVRFKVHVMGQPGVIKMKLHEAEGQPGIHIITRRSDGGEETEEHIVRLGAAEGEHAQILSGHLKKIQNGHGGAWMAKRESVGEWLLENIDADPTTEQVKAYIAVVEKAPLVAFGVIHPEADTDADGQVSAAERDAFIKQQAATMQAKMFERHPDADLDGDGELTKAELHEYLMSNSGEWQTEGGTRYKVMRKIDDQGNVNVEVIATTDDDK